MTRRININRVAVYALSVVACFLLAGISCKPVKRNPVLAIEKLETGVTSSIRALCIVNENTIWASGSEGSYLLSTDGGAIWKTGVIVGADDADFRSIYAWDSQNAIVFGVGSPGRAYITSTAGEDWEEIYENNTPGIFFNSLCFADEMNGIALSDAIDSIPFLIKTIDGGQNWTRIKNLPVLKPGEAHFAASNTCIDYKSSGNIWFVTGGTDSRVFHSGDDGASWSVVAANITHRSPSSGVFSVSFTDDRRGLIVGGTYDNPGLNDSIAAYSDDGGETWVLSDKMPAGYRSCVLWLGEKNNVALAVGKTGWDFSYDYGRKWTFLSDSGYYTAMAIPGTFSGFAAGSNGRMAKFKLE